MSDLLSQAELVRRIHSAPGQMVLAITGGGSRAISDLLSVPGGSLTLLEAIVPYSAVSLEEFLRARPEHFCSASAGRMMAMAAFQRAQHLQDKEPTSSTKKTGPPIGISCTASLASDRQKRGAHRIHAAMQTIDGTSTHSLELTKGRRNRIEEETVATQIILNTAAEAFGVGIQLPLQLLENERVASMRTIAPPAWRDLLLGRTQIISGLSSVRKSESANVRRAIFPGAFNPLHEGHLRMAEVASRRFGMPAEFELSIENVEKPLLDYTEIAQRIAQFNEKQLPLWLTRASTFEEKSALFQRAVFIVGADTIMRIGQPRYYGNDPAAAAAAIARIAQRGCRFLVFGRLIDNEFKSCAGLPLSHALRQLCDEVPATDFRHDVSSTQLRSQATAG